MGKDERQNRRCEIADVLRPMPVFARGQDGQPAGFKRRGGPDQLVQFKVEMLPQLRRIGFVMILDFGLRGVQRPVQGMHPGLELLQLFVPSFPGCRWAMGLNG